MSAHIVVPADKREIAMSADKWSNLSGYAAGSHALSKAGNVAAL